MTAMNLLTVAQIEVALAARYGKKASQFPDFFGELIPKVASVAQATEVSTVIRKLTDRDCSTAMIDLWERWDFTRLNVANFNFGYKSTFAERLEDDNRSDAIGGWWEGAFEQRPKTLLFIAQGDPYVILLDMQSEAVLAYQAGDGAMTAVKIASDLTRCVRMLSTIQLFKPEGSATVLTIAEVKFVLGEDCDERFWSEQIRHWSELP